MVSPLLGKRDWLAYLCQDGCAKAEGTTACYLSGPQEHISEIQAISGSAEVPALQ